MPNIYFWNKWGEKGMLCGERMGGRLPYLESWHKKSHHLRRCPSKEIKESKTTFTPRTASQFQHSDSSQVPVQTRRDFSKERILGRAMFVPCCSVCQGRLGSSTQKDSGIPFFYPFQSNPQRQFPQWGENIPPIQRHQRVLHGVTK